MQIITTHKGADFDAAASVLAAKILYPEAVAVLPKSLNPNVAIGKKKVGVKRPGKGIYVNQGIYNRTRKQSNEGGPLDDLA
jgi:hypothetical protein